MGKPTQAEEFLVLVKHLADQMLGRPTSPSRMRLLRIPEARMSHGACQIEGMMAGLVFFEDLEMGLLAAPSPEGRTNFCRFIFKVPWWNEEPVNPVT